uniref:Anaphase-promoting complex subunit 10 n=1 Tax=Equus caballus TaxID=9796 RepID=A0A9L0S6V2_HORSE
MTTPNKTPPGADPKQLERTGTVREIGSQAVWSLSSCKPGFGVDQLRDDNLETYWQSDGSQPHLVNIQFRRKTTVKTLCIYADYKSDESYTPSKISVRVGNNFHNLQEIRQLELVEPSGWIHVPLTDNHKKPTRTFMIQIAVLANHQNGRDTHMRQIKIYTPVEESSIEYIRLLFFTPFDSLGERTLYGLFGRYCLPNQCKQPSRREVFPLVLPRKTTTFCI